MQLLASRGGAASTAQATSVEVALLVMANILLLAQLTEGPLDAGTPSTTAMLAALGRGRHRWFDPEPWVLDDPFAMLLVGPDWPALAAMMSAVASETVMREAPAAHAARCRYAEDRLDLGVHRQYVILGAGLDSFAWRRPDLLGLPDMSAFSAVDDATAVMWRAYRDKPWYRRLRVFEVDHPATQAWKRERVRALTLPVYEDHRFAPIDFETTTLEEGLSAAGFDWGAPTLFSWLGVTMYLTLDAIEAILRTVARCPDGSEIAFTYVPVPDEQDDGGRDYLEMFRELAAGMGEPFRTLLSGHDVEQLVARAGLRVVDHPTRDELTDRYFRDRADSLRPSTFERLVTAAR